MGLHMMDPPQPARSTIRRTHTVQYVDGSPAMVVALHGSLQFAGAERLVRDLSDADADGGLADAVVLDLSRVHSINDVARRMLLETVRRLHLEDIRVTLVDPETTLPDPDCGDGIRPAVVGTVAEAAALGNS